MNGPLDRRLASGLLLVLGLGPIGCPPAAGPDARITRIQVLEDKVQTQARQLVDRDQQLAAAAGTIQSLRGLDGDRRLDKLVHVARLEIGRLSGGYDDDRDGVLDGVVIHLQLLDEDGDAVKAAGSAKVRLFDLSRPAGSREVGAVELSPDQLRPLWFGRLLTYHYTIKVPWSSPPATGDRRRISLVVDFTELLSGSTLSVQSIVDVAGGAAATP